MMIAKVLGPVIATIKHESLKARTIYVIQPLDDAQKPKGTTLLALDSVQARPGDVVLVTREGGSCRQILKDDLAPVNSLITGIIDAIGQ